MPARAGSPAAVARTGGLVWGAIGVLAFSGSLPATRLAVTGRLPPDIVDVGWAMVAGLLGQAAQDEVARVIEYDRAWQANQEALGVYSVHSSAP